MRAGILQPSYLPWLGYFDQMAQSDVFVIYDDVQYDRDGWRNRNKIKTPQGWQWLTVPVTVKGKPDIRDVEVDNHAGWYQDHAKAIRQNYSRAPFFKDYVTEFEGAYRLGGWPKLINLNLHFLQCLKGILGIRTELVLASTLRCDNPDRVRRLIDLCRRLGADEFLEGSSGRNYLAVDGEKLFAAEGITLQYHDYQHPVYPQLYGPFLPFLSVIDLIFNCGPESLSILTHGRGK